MKLPGYCTFVLLLSFVTPLSIDAQEIGWFEGADSSCSGPTSLRIGLRDSGWLKSIDTPQSTPGKVYARLPASTVNQALSSGNSIIYDTASLDANKAATVKRLITAVAEGTRVPFATATFISILPGFILSAGSSAFAGTVFAWLIEEQNAAAASLASLPLIIADGGELHKIVSVKRRDDKSTYTMVTYSYRVDVGKEPRHVLLASCAYAVEIMVEEFKTDAEFNNKVIHKVDGEWRQFDIEGNKYDAGTFEYVGQDKEFYYFGKYNDGTFDARYRISMQGGPMQYERDESWRTLYSKVVAN